MKITTNKWSNTYLSEACKQIFTEGLVGQLTLHHIFRVPRCLEMTHEMNGSRAILNRVVHSELLLTDKYLPKWLFFVILCRASNLPLDTLVFRVSLGLNGRLDPRCCSDSHWILVVAQTREVWILTVAQTHEDDPSSTTGCGPFGLRGSFPAWICFESQEEEDSFREANWLGTP